MVKKALIIFESPTKARTVTKYLGDKFIVMSSYGHVWDLRTSGKNNLGVNIENNFEPKYGIIPERKDKLRAIVKTASGAKEILIASDPDREGEAIAWHLAETLEKTGIPIKRILINEYTKDIVEKAIKNPSDLNSYLYDAQQARRVLDRIVGFTVSPFLIEKFGPNLSAGRVQSVAVRLVVEREREIEEFKSEDYWNINAAFNKDGEKFTAKYPNKITDKKTASKIKKDLESDSFTISSIEKIEKKKEAPPPLITSSLTIASGNKYKFSAKKTMKAAQSLYENGLITYMRTDSLRCSSEAIAACRKYIKDNNYDLPSKPNEFKNSGKTQDGHEAIRPTDVSLLPQGIYVSEDEHKIYNLIWERFVASQMKPAIYNKVNVVISSCSGHDLKVTGSTLKYKGWTAVADVGRKKETRLPSMNKNDSLDKPVIKSEKKSTKPPARFTEVTLTRMLEDKKIGRPSTFVSILSKLTYRNYVKKKGDSFYATDLGKQVTDKLVSFFKFMDYSYTAKMEEELDKIAEGSLTYTQMLSNFYEPFKKQIKKAYFSSEKNHDHKCPKCSEFMLLKHGRLGYYLKCYECKKTVSCDIIDDKPVIRINKKNLVPGVKCPKCGAGMVEMPGRFGPFYSCSEYVKTRCRGIRKVPFGKKCPDCKDELYATIYKNQNVLFCMNSECYYKEDLPGVYLTDPKKLCDNDKLPKRIKKLLS